MCDELEDVQADLGRPDFEQVHQLAMLLWNKSLPAHRPWKHIWTQLTVEEKLSVCLIQVRLLEQIEQVYDQAIEKAKRDIDLGLLQVSVDNALVRRGTA